MARLPVVAGKFYPASPERLSEEVAKWLETAESPVKALAVVSPHAGYAYSGRVAGAVYGRVLVPKQVVIVGVNHQGFGADAAIMTEGSWATPLGEVPIAEKLARSILERSKTLRDDPQAHKYEHSLEVQVPFLQYLRPELEIVPIALYRADRELCLDVGEACAKALSELDTPALLVASTDLSHEQQDYERLKSNDPVAIDRILNLDPEGLLREVAVHRITMCGYGPTAAVLVAAKLLGASEAVLVSYSDSYAVTGSDDYVVGYAGIYID